MKRWSRAVLLACVMMVVASLSACTSENPGSGSNDWNVGGGADSGSTSDADAGTIADGGSDDAGSSDTSVLPDASTSDTGSSAATPFTAEGLSSAPWYGVSALTVDPVVTGVVLPLEFHTDMSVTVGFDGAVTGQWEKMGSNRVRLTQLTKADGSPNQPTEFILDADLDGDNIKGLELVIPQGPDGSPYVLRFEQVATPEVSVDDISGSWQSQDTYDDGHGNSYRLALRVLGGYLGYGFFNGAYVEYVGGDASTITYDDGKTFWFYDPGSPDKPALAGEVTRDAAGNVVLYAPRQTNPNQTPAHFEAVQMDHVDSFGL